MNRSIKVDAVSKRYELGLTHAGSIRELSNIWARRLVGRPSPSALPVGSEVAPGAGARHTEKGEFWALRDVSFEVGAGEVVGIIGRNGAGKSTLLKLLSRITYPTKGRVELSGRVASLLEVGTGFHPELTGRENVFLNGTILGMTRREVEQQLDAIVDFSGIEQFLDTPVKRYSSGMTVRLGFAVAAHLNPEILIVDEVLAVGDIDFQRRCIARMRSVAESGRTVLFVSHNLGSIRSLTKRAIVLTDGALTFDGTTPDGIAHYVSENLAVNEDEDAVISAKRTIRGLDLKLRFSDLRLANRNPDGSIGWDGAFDINVGVTAQAECHPFVVGVTVYSSDQTPVGTSRSEPLIAPGVGQMQHYQLGAKYPLAPGRYHCVVSLSSARSGGRELHDWLSGVLSFDVPDRPIDDDGSGRPWAPGSGFFRLNALQSRDG